MAAVTAEALARVRERLKAYIYPNEAATEGQARAFESAAACQAAYEAANEDALDAARRGVQRISAGDYSETYFAPQAGGSDADGICPDARALLFNAGLLRHGLPCARRL